MQSEFQLHVELRKHFYLSYKLLLNFDWDDDILRVEMNCYCKCIYTFICLIYRHNANTLSLIN